MSFTTHARPAGREASYTTRKTDFYGAPIGLIMIDSNEPFIPGDLGNASTFGYPVRYEMVEGCSIERLVVNQGDPTLREDVVRAAQRLQDCGVRAIGGICGFFMWFQDDVADAVDIPVMLSSLLQMPFVLSTIGRHRKLGVITASAPSLTPELIKRAGVRDVDRLAIVGLEESPNFAGSFLGEGGTLDPDAVEAEVVAAAERLRDEHDDVAAIVMECGVLAPYAAAIQRSVRLPVFDGVTLVDYWYRSLTRPTYIGHY